MSTKNSKPGCVQVAFTALLAFVLLGIALNLMTKTARDISSGALTTTVPSTTPDGSTIVPESQGAATPNYFSVEIECPEPGEGYRLAGHATNEAPGPLRVTLISSLGSEYLGELGPYERLRPASRFGPNTVIGFDVQTVNEVGQGGETYRLGLATPAVPC